MSAARRKQTHETGDAKMKAAAIKSVRVADPQEPVASPAKELQEQLSAHYQPFARRMSVMLISVLFAFAFIGGWLAGSGTLSFA